MAVFSLPNYIFGPTHWQVLSKTALAYKKNGVYVGITFGELRESVESFAKALLERGVKQQEPFCILADNCPEWVIADFGIMMAGGVTVPIHTSFSDEYISYILSQTEASVIIMEKRFLDRLLLFREDIQSLKTVILFNVEGVKEVLENGQVIEGKDHWQRISEQYRISILHFSELLFEGRDLEKPLYRIESGGDAVATIVYTSGTTGMPKGVVLTHRNLIVNIQDILHYIHLLASDVFLSFLPLSHMFERTAGCFAPLSAGATIFFAENPKTVAKNLLEVKPTVLVSVPRIYEKIYGQVEKEALAAPYFKKEIFLWGMNCLKAAKNGAGDFMVEYRRRAAEKIAHILIAKKIQRRLGGRLRLAVSGGAKLHNRIAHFFHTISVRILEGYGTTETSPIISCNLYDNIKIGSAGKPLRSVEVKIADDGEILVKGGNVMKGYYKDAKKTKEAFSVDGWFRTGDIGYLDNASFLHITGRKKEIIITSGGKNVAPHVIEQALVMESHYIAQAMIVGEGKRFIIAILVPDFENVRKAMIRSGIHGDIRDMSHEDIVKYPGVVSLFEAEIARSLKRFAEYEKVKKFFLALDQFTMENDLLTPTLKLKRQNIFKKYKREIDALYDKNADNAD